MANEKNLKPPLNKRTTNEQREITRKGGIKSGQSRREKKLLKEVILDLLYSNSKLDKTKTNQELMVASLFEKALTGDAKAFEVLRDTSGQKPIDKQEVKADFGVQKIFITEKDKKQADKLIDKIHDDLFNDFQEIYNQQKNREVINTQKTLNPTFAFDIKHIISFYF